MNFHVSRAWVQASKNLLPPVGVARGWIAIEHGVAVAAIFEAIAPLTTPGTFMLCYHAFGEQRGRVERFNSFDAAQQQANRILSEVKVVPRTLPGMAGSR